ncbi:hypothetical protein [Halegenticoccus tardaugens]|uniref:hypothetical protein n=1 Tax=Halegenticoccus tardaugens TaxID=2071624 RepID=UPI001E51AC70|nr:hypothetical protein [Halegenticoccus tardaugens]
MRRPTTPSAVGAVVTAEARDDQTIDDVYSDLVDWVPARGERERYERARQQRADINGKATSGSRRFVCVNLSFG